MGAIVGFTAAYRESSERLGFCALACLEQGGGCTPGPSSDVIGAPGQADFECEHGRLAGDTCPSPAVTYLDGTTVQSWPHDHPCGCWPSEQITVERIAEPMRETAPNLMTTLRRAEEAVMQTTKDPDAPFGRDASGKPNAPYGHKADGTIKRSNGGRARKAAAQLAAAPATRTAPAPEPDPDPPAAAASEEEIIEADIARDEAEADRVRLVVHEDPIRAAVAKIDEQVSDLFLDRQAVESEIADLEEQVRKANERRAAILERASNLNGARRALTDLFPPEAAEPVAA